jgi:PAS domain-containing protein
VINYETKLKRKDGKYINVSITLSPILDDKGKLKEIAAITRNITEQKQQQTAMEENDKKYRLVTENMWPCSIRKVSSSSYHRPMKKF